MYSRIHIVIQISTFLFGLAIMPRPAFYGIIGLISFRLPLTWVQFGYLH